MSEIKQRISEDIKAAMRAQEKERTAAIRLILAAVKQKEVDDRIELDDEMMITLLDKLAKQRRESITQFSKADRADLIAQEEFELDIILSYLPAQLSEDEIQSLVEQAIGQSGAAKMSDMGRVMAILKPQLQGRADMALVSRLIKQRLS